MRVYRLSIGRSNQHGNHTLHDGTVVDHFAHRRLDHLQRIEKQQERVGQGRVGRTSLRRSGYRLGYLGRRRAPWNRPLTHFARTQQGLNSIAPS